MTTENKAEAEKIADNILAGHIARQSINTWDYKQTREDLLAGITKALLDFREKDVRELVEAIVKIDSQIPHSDVCLYGCKCHCAKSDIAALVRKFKGGDTK